MQKVILPSCDCGLPAFSKSVKYSFYPPKEGATHYSSLRELVCGYKDEKIKEFFGDSLVKTCDYQEFYQEWIPNKMVVKI